MPGLRDGRESRADRQSFAELGVEDAFAVTMEANLASRQVMEKSGLVFLREFYNEEFPGTVEKDVGNSISKVNWKPQLT